MAPFNSRPQRRPYVVAHTAVALDGATTGFAPDTERFYALAATWREDITLAGADTILAQEKALASAPRPGPAADGPLLAVVDARRRIRQWDALREVGHWSGVIALYAESTPARPPGSSVPELVTGTDRVDLAEAIDTLGRNEGAEVVRVDSGGSLTGALLSAGLLDEVSLLVHPCLAGATGGHQWYGSASHSAHTLELIANETFDDGLVWLRYRVA
ncbi:dihydrofolate reductase family protein [Streptomyces sp. TRM66268-LWL]|uniref:Dihydrofolate reductase family protein n=1 Tax=Streptomyces polyasparticus TaxID=2767826 RepID=A0ABR7SKF7_9ACTN|nr:dihydrofolate reductase family protein [Streptomyces polyasparticus]MBC9715950.1 dihydrofolate reductase family protein [Streptomyces polyasparticus]